MRILRQVTIGIVVLASLAVAAPAFAQNFDLNVTPAKHLWPSLAPELTTKTAPAAQKEQGLGVFLQGGYVYQTTYTGSTSFTSKPQGFIVGIGFGGNKSGAVGAGVDINYIFTNNSDANQKTQTLDIPVYARFNIGGHNTKNSFTFYIPAGWFFDINLSNQFDGINFKDSFNGLQTGPLVGAGFEVVRIAVEARAQWALTQLLKNGDETFGGDAKQFTFIVLFKVRLN
jgi:hypothetical protein